MAKRRANNEGTIYQLPSGSWRAQVSVGGQRLSHTAKTQKEIREWVKKTVGQVDQGLTYESTRTRFGDFVDDWLANKSTTIRPRSFEQYRRVVKLHVKPCFGEVKLKDVTPAKIQSVYNRMQAEGIGVSTIELLHIVIHQVLDHAQLLGLVTRNSADAVIVPAQRTQEMSVWSEEQVAGFLVSVRGNRLEPLLQLALATGMRRGELTGLKWIDIDWGRKTIYVRRQVYHPEGGGWAFQPPKSERGVRTVQVGDGIIASLRKQYNETIPIMRSMSGDKWQENDLVFPSTIGTPLWGHSLSTEFTKLIRKSGLSEIRFHDMRHTAASLMLNHGIPPVVVATILGHSLAMLMDRYAHYIPGHGEGAALLMDELTSPISIDIPTK